MDEKFVNINDRSEFVDALADLLTSCHTKHKSGCLAPDCRECIDRFFGISNGHLLPAADVVEVVRCKDCKHLLQDLSEREAHLCTRNRFVRGQVKLDDFCSYGERKEQ